MLFDPIDTQQLSQDSLILQFDITSDYTKYRKKVCPKFLTNKVGKTVNYPKTTVSLQSNHTHLGYNM